MSFNVALYIPINFNDNHVKKAGQACYTAAPQPGEEDWLPPSPNWSPNPDANDNDTPNAEYVAQINNQFQPVYNLNGIRVPSDEFMHGFPWNEYNWHYRNQYPLDRQLGYFRHDGSRPVQPTPVYPPVDQVNLSYGNKHARVGRMGFVGGFDGLGRRLMSGRAEANTSRPRAEPPRGDSPRNREGTSPQPFDQRPRPRMKHYGGLGLRNFGGGDPAEHDHPPVSGGNPSPNFNPENKPFGGKAHCDDRSRVPFPMTNPQSLDLKALIDSLREELTIRIQNIFEKFQTANIVSSPSSESSLPLVNG